MKSAALQRDLTAKQRMVLDYMRGNGGVLTGAGRAHLIGRGSFQSSTGISIVLSALVRRGLADRPDEVVFREGGVPLLATLTKAGRRG